LQIIDLTLGSVVFGFLVLGALALPR